MNILITGASGLLGKHLFDEIVSDTSVTSTLTNYYYLVSRNINHDEFNCPNTFCINADLMDTNQVNQLFASIRPHVVVHLASPVGGLYSNLDNNYKFLTDGIQIHLNIVKFCEVFRVKYIINILSTCIFPETGVTLPLSSDQLHNGLPHFSNRGYAQSKRFLHTLSKSYYDKYECKHGGNDGGVRIVNFIPTNLYGLYDHFGSDSSHVIPALIYKFNKYDTTLKGSGQALRQFVYAGDLAKIIMRTIDYFKTGACSHGFDDVIVGPNEIEEVTIFEVARIIREHISTHKPDILGYPIKYDMNYIDGQYRKTVNTAELDTFLGKMITVFPLTNLSDGIKKVVRYYLKNTGVKV